MYPLKRRAWLGALGAAAVAPALTACAALDSPMAAALRRHPPAGLPRRADLSSVPFVSSDDGLCGPAALAMVLAAAGAPAPMATLTEAVYLPGRDGALQAEMLAAARRQGALAFLLAPTLTAALTEVAAGTPVLVLLNLALPWWPRWHYAVLVGYDLDRDLAVLHTGTRRADAWPLDTLAHTWFRAGAWGLVVQPPGRWPATVDEASAVTAVAAFEHTQGPAAAEAAWRAARLRWPEALASAVGLGNNLLAQARWDEAAQVLAAAAQRHDSAAAWNNLAVAEARRGRQDAARTSLDRAERRARAAEPQWAATVAATRRELGF
ncbi:MAG: PA2778 family cysteine peptidase [Vitreoscilla sp.]|nr:PA2778 family cysteine peptidase [Vitreoscilla sp.]